MKKFLIILGVTSMLSVFGIDTTEAAEKCYDMQVLIDCGNGKTCIAACSGHNLQEIYEEAEAVAADFC